MQGSDSISRRIQQTEKELGLTLSRLPAGVPQPGTARAAYPQPLPAGKAPGHVSIPQPTWQLKLYCSSLLHALQVA